MCYTNSRFHALRPNQSLHPTCASPRLSPAGELQRYAAEDGSV